MSKHVFGAVITAEGIAANNRGENSGNTTTLQKVIRNGEIYTTVSAEAIRYAIRERWTETGEPVNRSVSADGSTWKDPSFKHWENYLDDDVLGFMHPKEDTKKRRGRLEVSRALSLLPWTGDTVFNVASVGSHPRDNKDPIPYSSEVHVTRYQYLFALTPSALGKDHAVRAGKVLDAIVDLHDVAGNHARHLYEFAPEGVVLRVTEDPVPRMMYCFDCTEHGSIGLSKLLKSLEGGDIAGDELHVAGTPIADLERSLTAHGVKWYPGVKAAFAAAKKLIGAK